MQNVDKLEDRKRFLQSARTSNFRFIFFSFVLTIMLRALFKVAFCSLINWQQSRDVWKFTYFSRSYEYLLSLFYLKNFGQQGFLVISFITWWDLRDKSYYHPSD